MRIVAVADTHLFTQYLPPVPDGDIFVHAGDLIRRGSLEELAEGLPWLESLPHQKKIMVAGNHDWCFVRHPEEARAMLSAIDVIYLEDEMMVIDGFRFYGSPWQPAYNNWAFNLPRGQALAEKWQKIPENTDVLITHGPPKGIGDDFDRKRRSGCAALRKRVEECQPTLHLFGHIHQDGGFWQLGPTCFANVTTWECDRAATVIDYFSETGKVIPISVPPALLHK